MKQSKTTSERDSPSQPAESPRRSARASRQTGPVGHLTQLATLMNDSPQVQAQAQLKDDLQHGPHTQIASSPIASTAEIHQDSSAQFRGVAVNAAASDNAGLQAARAQREANAAAPLHRAARLSSTKPRQAAVVAQRAPVIQRAINTVVAYTDQVEASHQAKMNAVVQYLNTSLAGINNGIANLNINVKKMAATDPARTSRVGNDINVDLADWFVISSSVGDISGMLAHEIGVHTLASAQQNWGELNEEEQYQKHPFSVRVGLHTHTVSPWDDTRKWGGRQKDHVNVARDKGTLAGPLRSIKGQRQVDAKGKSLAGGPFDENSANRRAEEYAATMLRLGDAIEADGAIGQTEKDQRLHDLLNSFLFDYGRMLATDDVAWHVADKTPLVAQVFNWYKNVIIARHGVAHPWLQRDTMLPTASTWGLRAYLLARITQSLSAKVLPTAVHNAAGTVLNTGGRLLGGLGSAVASVTPDVVKQGGSLLASGAGKLLRGADYLYGEAENLVVPNVVAPLAWAGGKAKAGASWLGGAFSSWRKKKKD
jgi:hypothetical protein